MSDETVEPSSVTSENSILVTDASVETWYDAFQSLDASAKLEIVGLLNASRSRSCKREQNMLCREALILQEMIRKASDQSI